MKPYEELKLELHVAIGSQLRIAGIFCRKLGELHIRSCVFGEMHVVSDSKHIPNYVGSLKKHFDRKDSEVLR
jgi:hypothetical protein